MMRNPFAAASMPRVRPLLVALCAVAAGGCSFTSGTSTASLAERLAAPAARKPIAAAPVADSLSDREAARACLATADELLANGHDPEALALLERARALDPAVEPAVVHKLAVLYDRTGDALRARAEYDKALAARPRDADLLSDVGYFYYRRGNWAEAEGWFRKALAEQPRHERAGVNLGLTLAELRRYDESFRAFEQAVGPAAAHANVGAVLARQGRRAEAAAALEQALALEPDLPQARALLTAVR